jgi:hypothetical protein
MALNWNEIKERAVKFSKEWENTTNEEADAKPFLDAFFDVFGISRKKIGTFEHRVKKLSNADGYIDLLWKGVILVEMKSRGKNLDKAFVQAKEYTHGLKEHELPKYILVCDFNIFRMYDTEENETFEFALSDLVNQVQHFGFIAGYVKRTYKEQDPVNVKAAELMGKLHDRLKEIGYEGHPLEVYLVRILFCLFGEDTNIFEKQQFQDYIEQRTNIDGSDLAAKLQELFQVLNTSNEKRFKNLDEQLSAFPYVNGKLFDEILPTASFDSKMRQTLLECCYIDWSLISPAIFGSMFQSVMNPKERRNLGAHYTSEINILKLIKPLFLDELYKEFDKIKKDKRKLNEFHHKLGKLKFLDPACGCGNFLIITYRELRLLELEVIREILGTQQVFDLEQLILINVDQFYGIEYEEFPAQIAQVALWLMDHQMNQVIANEFGQYFARIPLKKSATIVHGDAMEINWETLSKKEVTTVYAEHLNYKVQEPIEKYGTLNVITKSATEVAIANDFPKPFEKQRIHYDYIVGNPPFIGSKIMSQYQRDQIAKQFDNIKGCGVLDYVSGWYIKAAKYIQNTSTKVGFVSTNSIVQGEQTSILWGQMLNKYGVKIHFAHRTFKWSNEAKGNAAVYCVIVGFANFDTTNKTIFEYEDIKGEPHEIKAKNINPYLVDAKDVFIEKRSTPLCNVPKIKFGNQPIDGGAFILDEGEKIEALEKEPFIEKYIRKYMGSEELINGKKRYCLWFNNPQPHELKQSKFILKRLEEVRTFRLKSERKETNKLADFPTQFAFISHEETDYIIIPSVSSERRKYIPMDMMPANIIASNLCLIIPNANLYHFGVLTSLMHLSWTKVVCGRLKSDYRYSNSIVYNNFPWPENPTEKQINTIISCVEKILIIRNEFPESTFADLYDPDAIPKVLLKAHQELDKAVDASYSKQVFSSEARRLEFLFELYEKYTGDLFSKEKVKKNKI